MVEIERKAGMVFVFAEDERDLATVSEQADVVYVRERPKGGLWFHVPRKITYQLQVPESVDAYLQSLTKSRRKNFRRALRNLVDLGVSFVFAAPPTADDFAALIDVYQQNMSDKEKGIAYFDTAWLEKNKQKAGVILAKIGGVVVGGLVYRKLAAGKHFPLRYSTSFVAARADLKDAGLVEALNLKFVELCVEKGIALINRGIDTNLYGHHLATGLYVFKRSLGYVPAPHPQYGLWWLQIASFDRFPAEVLFFGQEPEGEFVGYLLYEELPPIAQELAQTPPIVRYERSAAGLHRQI